MTDAQTPEELVAYYTEEGCPFLALALSDRYGYPLAVLFDVGRQDDWGQGAEDIPAHCFCWAPDGQALDVKGRRPIADLRADFFDLAEPVVYELSRSELEALCGDERPFYALTAAELAEAAAAISLLDLR
jgi:hypothetical protein